jgi:hypothetical protein
MLRGDSVPYQRSVIAKTGGRLLEVSAQWVERFRLWRRRGQEGLSVAAALCLAAVLAGLVVVNAGAQGATEDEGYSVYEDPQKAAIYYILSDPANADEFQGEFGLSDREVESVLAATRAENAAFTETCAESETILAESHRASPRYGRKRRSAPPLTTRR